VARVRVACSVCVRVCRSDSDRLIIHWFSEVDYSRRQRVVRRRAEATRWHRRTPAFFCVLHAPFFALLAAWLAFFLRPHLPPSQACLHFTMPLVSEPRTEMQCACAVVRLFFFVARCCRCHSPTYAMRRDGAVADRSRYRVIWRERRHRD